MKTDKPVARVVLLGASNLTRGLSAAIEVLQATLGSPLEIHAAIGNGRSYGQNSSFFVRRLPGISECGLWESLKGNNASVPTYALVSDIGNDVFFGSSVEQIVAWVGKCLNELRELNACPVVLGLPVCNLVELSAFRYHLFRNLFVPRCRLDQVSVISHARELHHALSSLCSSVGATFVEQRTAWYGHDPIHIKKSHYAIAWQEVLSNWWSDAQHTTVVTRQRFLDALYLATLVPQQREVMGMVQRKTQPAGYLRDGTTVSLY